jgi:hypothetical protein
VEYVKWVKAAHSQAFDLAQANKEGNRGGQKAVIYR